MTKWPSTLSICVTVYATVFLGKTRDSSLAFRLAPHAHSYFSIFVLRRIARHCIYFFQDQSVYIRHRMLVSNRICPILHFFFYDQSVYIRHRVLVSDILCSLRSFSTFFLSSLDLLYLLSVFSWHHGHKVITIHLHWMSFSGQYASYDPRTWKSWKNAQTLSTTLA
jgi:hypothetical protein